LIFSSIHMSAQDSQGSYIKPADARVLEKLEQWQRYKFGLLMHWGPYSQWGVVESWSICAEDEGWCFQGDDYLAYKQKYEKLPYSFNPVDFDPVKWAKAAKYAGMRYVVFTTKHHDGFCMFDTKTTDYKITSKNCPYHSNSNADVTQKIFTAFRAQGMMVGAYFSKPDWNSPYFWWPKFTTPDRNVNYSIVKYPERWKKFVDFTHTQIDEICSNYGNIDILWLDGGWVRPLKPEEMVFSATVDGLFRQQGYTQLKTPQNQDVEMDQIVKNARQKQPGLIVVDRSVEGPNQNYLTPEQSIPANYLPVPWETCLTMGDSWSYKPNDRYKPARQLIQTLADIVSKGGNLLLNIGPGPDGKWDNNAYDRLQEIGNWMAINNEAIYNTEGRETFAERNLRFTKGKDGRLFVIYLVSENEAKLPADIVITTVIPQKDAVIHLLGFKNPVKWKKTGNALILSIPKEMQNNPPGKYAWVFSISKEINNK